MRLVNFKTTRAFLHLGVRRVTHKIQYLPYYPILVNSRSVITHKGWIWSHENILTLVFKNCCFSFTVHCLFIPGFSAPYWVSYDVNNTERHQGLWRVSSKFHSRLYSRPSGCTPYLTMYSRTYGELQTLQYTPDLTVYSRPYSILQTLQCTPDLTVYSTPYSVLQTLQYTPDLTVYSRPYCVLQTLQCTPDLTMYTRPYNVLQTLQYTPDFTVYSRPYSVLQTLQ